MSVQVKPILHNGFDIKKDISIVKRVERLYFTEVYLLSNDHYLYLFTNLSDEEIINQGKKKDLIKIKYGEKGYLGLVVEDHSHQNVSKILDELTILKGFQSIAGMRDLKEMFIKDVINPLMHPERFKKFKVSIPNGILLYGPPGCGKTFIVKKLAEELGYNFNEVKHSDLATPYIHGAVGNIGKVFEMAKNEAPTILCFNEIDGLVPSRKRSLDSGSSHKTEEVNQFLTELEDAADNNVLVVGTTNLIENMDEAVLRVGRFDKKIFIPPPDFEARKELFRYGLSGRPYDKKINFNKLAEKTENYSSSDIVEGIIESSARLAANQDKALIDQKILEMEIKNYKPVVEKEEVIGFST